MNRIRAAHHENASADAASYESDPWDPPEWLSWLCD